MKKTSLFSLVGVLVCLIFLANPVSAVGVFRSTSGNWILDYNNTGIAYKTVHFGTTGDIPVTGDWNNDGSTDAGVFRPSSGDWALETTKTGAVYKKFRFGTTGDIPVTGDWNNDGSTDAGVFRPSSGDWILETAKTGVVYKKFRFGTTGDTPVTGDWNNDGATDIGVFRPSSGDWILETAKSGVVYKRFRFGTTGDIPVTGDWNNDGSCDAGIFRSSIGDWALETTKTGAVYRKFHFGTQGDLPKALQLLPPGAPVAAFTSDIQSGNAPLTVRFSDESTGSAPLAYVWDFNNDGIPESTAPSPSYTFRVPGIYTVNLTVTNKDGSDSERKPGYITVTAPPVAPSADFTADVRYGYAPLTVRFTNESAGTAPLTFAWDFTNDGEDDSTLSNPTFTYSTPGSYTVKLTVTNNAGSDSEIKYWFINVYEVPVVPVADFSANKRSGPAPLTVRFTDNSNGSAPMEYAWDFNNDGRDDSYARDPTFTYSYPGTYTVRHTVSNDAGSDGETKTGYITVTEGQPGGSNAGIALTFDDNSVDQWYAIRGLLQQYNAHATFFVSQPGNLDESQLDKLRTLQADGHEIGYHGYAHLDAAAYLQSHSIQQYLDNEITPGVNLMKNAGLNPADFAYPYGSESDSLTAALAAYFGHVRGTHSAVYSPLYYEYGSGQLLIQGIGIDDLSYGNTINEIYNAISGAKQEDEIIIFYAHVPVETVSGDYQISYDRLEKILIYGSDNNMKFYTVSELT